MAHSTENTEFTHEKTEARRAEKAAEAGLPIQGKCPLHRVLRLLGRITALSRSFLPLAVSWENLSG